MKRIRRLFVIGVCLGIVLLVFKEAFHLDGKTFFRGYLIAAPLFVAGCVLASVVYNLSYQRRLRGLLPLLLEKGQPEAFIAEVEGLLDTAKGAGLRQLLRLNLAAGYMEAKQYDTAVELLESMLSQKMRPATAEMICRLNLYVSYFFLQQYDKAMELYQDSRELFEKYRGDKNYGGNVAAVEIEEAVLEKKYDQAEILINQAEQAWKDPRLQETFWKLRDFLRERRGAEGEE